MLEVTPKLATHTRACNFAVIPHQIKTAHKLTSSDLQENCKDSTSHRYSQVYKWGRNCESQPTSPKTTNILKCENVLFFFERRENYNSCTI